MPILMDTTFEDKKLMMELVDRTAKILDSFGMIPKSKQDARDTFLVSLILCHNSGCLLDLEGLSAASDGVVLHDVCGISANINGDNGQLENCFLPRFTMTQRKQTMDEHEKIDRLNARNKAIALS